LGSKRFTLVDGRGSPGPPLGILVIRGQAEAVPIVNVGALAIVRFLYMTEECTTAHVISRGVDVLLSWQMIRTHNRLLGFGRTDS
jgi:hypothetical protein